MIVGTIKEVLDGELRVGLTPSSVGTLVSSGHKVLVEKDAGLNSGISNKDYIEAGATLVDTAKEVWDSVDLLVKVKEPSEDEYKYFRKGLTIFGFLHLANHKDMTEKLIEVGASAISYETILTEDRELPALKPMSAIAGKMSALIGSEYLQSSKGGSGVLISGIPGVQKGNAVVVGAGNVGINALEMLVGLGANVTILDVNVDRLSELEERFGNRIETLYSSEANLRKAITKADLVVGAVSLPGASTPKLIKREYYKDMRKGSVIVDVAIDMGGSTEVSRKTSHADPIFVVDGIIHYCVPNIPGAVPISATEALNNNVIKYTKMIADLGVKESALANYEMRNGLCIYEGRVINKAVSDSLNLKLEKL